MGKPIGNKIYDLYGRFYDCFELLFKERLARAIRAIPFHSADHVLDIGIGTGLSLQHYPAEIKVTGLDLSPGMLQQAQRKLDDGKVRANAPRDYTRLIEGNALDLPFSDSTFDCVFLSHVLSTVPDARRCLNEAIRVAREGAYIVMVNHFRSPYPFLSWLETAIDPICRPLGWRCDLSLEDLLNSCAVGGNPRDRTGMIFTMVYLQKQHDVVRVVPMPTPDERGIILDAANL